MLIRLGVAFIALNGTLSLTHYYDRLGLTEAYADWTRAIQDALAGPIGAVLSIGAVVVLAWALLRWWRRPAEG